MAPFLVLGLAALAAATPMAWPPFFRPPAISESDGFTLQIIVPDLATDFHSTPVHLTHVVGVHVGAGMDMATPDLHGAGGAVFHTNGTAADLLAARGTVVAGFGTHALAWRNVRDPDDANLNGAVLQYGPGTEGVRVINHGGELMLGPGQYMVCDRKLPYGLSVEMTTAEEVPKQCVAVQLRPKCVELGVDPKDQTGQTVSRTACVKKSPEE